MQEALSEKSELLFHPSSRGRARGFRGGCTKGNDNWGRFYTLGANTEASRKLHKSREAAPWL